MVKRATRSNTNLPDWTREINPKNPLGLEHPADRLYFLKNNNISIESCQ